MSMICLFDMDGTLTPARKPMPIDVLEALKILGKIADIGIVSGSPMNYIKEQAAEFMSWFNSSPAAGETFIMPCNGTQLYKNTEEGYKLESSADMRKEVGSVNYKNIIRACISTQELYLTGWNDNNIPPITGNFISYRNSLLNFCPPGRDSTDEDRTTFCIYDKEFDIRLMLRDTLLSTLADFKINNISCTLGGNTSIDIYPHGWDKTYCLRHLKEYSHITFVGDKCGLEGNDYTLYNRLSPNSYTTDSTDNTVELIYKILIPMAEKRIN